MLISFILNYILGYDKTPTNKEIACAEGKLRCNEDYERSLELTPGNHKHICQKLEYAFKCTHNLGCEISESEIEHNIRTFSEVVNLLHCPFTLREFVNRKYVFRFVYAMKRSCFSCASAINKKKNT
uniref:Uncharacterized protein n=1 Tax=Biomphalaria glabrata TaxID=6526 RepID=A0A2C9KNE4_BIOGL